MASKNAQLRKKLSAQSTVVGIDIASTSINAVQLTKYKDKWVLLNAVIIPIKKDGAVSEEMLLSNAVNKIGNIFNLKKAKIIGVVNNCTVTTVRSVLMPSMPKKDLKAAIELEATNILSNAVDSIYTDYTIIDKDVPEGGRRQQIVIGISPKNTIDTLIRIFQKGLGKVPYKLIPISDALENVVFYNQADETREYVAMLEMSSRVSELNICRRGKIVFSRKIPVNGEDLSKNLTQPLMSENGPVQLSLDEAEDVKREHHIVMSKSTELAAGKIPVKQLFMLIRPQLEQIVLEIERSFDFFREQYSDAVLNKLILLGGAAQLRGFDEYCQKELNIDVVYEYPFEKVDHLDEAPHDSIRQQHKLTLALGAALDEGRGLNFLPPEMRYYWFHKIKKLSVKVVFTLLWGSAVLVNTGLYFYMNAIHEEWGYRQREYASLMPILTQIKENQLKQNIKKDQRLLAKPLRTLSHLFPDNMYLTSLSINKNTVILKGLLRQQHAQQRDISALLVRLAAGPFDEVTLLKTQQERDGVRFEIGLQIP